jgi:hypothetical protein
VVVALATGASGAAEVAERCAVALRSRGATGDEELARASKRHIRAAIGMHYNQVAVW